MSPKELIALGCALIAFAGAGAALQRASSRGNGRAEGLRRVLREADPRRDVLFLGDDAPDVVSSAGALPVVANATATALGDLAGFRRAYTVLADGTTTLPWGLAVRLGTPTRAVESGDAAREWELVGRHTPRLDFVAEFLSRGRVRREGGRFDGPCVSDGLQFRCNSPDAWNHARVEPRLVDGVQVQCIFAHPQADSTLVIELPNTPPAQNVVGAMALDDTAVFPNGAEVLNAIRFDPADGTAPSTLVAHMPNRRGPEPYRLSLGGRPGTLSFRITTANAGARVYCFTALLTN